MKKNLLLAMLVLSTFAMAQFNQRMNPAKQAEKTPMEIIKSFPDKKTWKTPGTITAQKINELINAQQTMAAEYQLMDSIINWNLDLSNGEWKNSDKTIKMTYDNKNRLISLIVQNWDLDTQEWVNSGKSTYTYNNNGDVTQLLMEGWDEGEWINTMKSTMNYDRNNNLINSKIELWMDEWIALSYTEFTYDNNHNVLTEINQAGLFGPLKNETKEIFTYDTKNNVLTSIHQVWNGEDWENQSKITNTYNAKNYILTYTNQTWESGSWLYFNKQTFTYNSNDDETLWLSQMWKSGNWENIAQHISTYDTRQNLTTQIQQSWENGAWVNYQKYAYTYNNSDLQLTELVQDYRENAWVNVVLSTSTYDTRGNNTSETTQIWLDNAWYRTGLTQETYDMNNYNLTYVNRGFDMDGETILSGDSSRFYYHPVSSGIPETIDEQLTVYPNPVKDYLILKIDAASSLTGEMMSYSLFDLSGKLLESRKLEGNVTRISMRRLPPATYVIKISDGNKARKEFKIIKM